VWVTSGALQILGILLELFGLSLLMSCLAAMPAEDADCKSDRDQHEDCAPGQPLIHMWQRAQWKQSTCKENGPYWEFIRAGTCSGIGVPPFDKL
jgi:uncharacterized membrane protein